MSSRTAKPVALVTGAARGIGAATVAALAREGWFVLAVDRAADDPRLPYALGSDAELDAVVARAGAGCASRFTADVTLEGEIAAAVRASGQHGCLQAVVAAAGAIAGGCELWKMDAAALHAVLEINLGGVISTARATIPALLGAPHPRQGRFIAVSSTAASRGLPMLAAYCAAKAGVSGLVRALALELRGSGVTANAISPGSTRTALLDESARLYKKASAEDFAAQQPLERLLEPTEVAALIAWLAGPNGAAITGADLAVDGGLAL